MEKTICFVILVIFAVIFVSANLEPINDSTSDNNISYTSANDIFDFKNIFYVVSLL